MGMQNGETKGRGRTVVVVGAGAAGLQAANVLLESEACVNERLGVIVLEGRDRVGGRISVDKRWGQPFDLGILTRFSFVILGPNWIHGTLSNPLIPIAKLAGSRLTFPDEGSQIVYTSPGERLPPETSRLLYDCIWRYAAEAINFSTDEGESVPPEWSMYDFCVERIREDKALDTELKHLALQLVELLTTFTAVDVRKQSLRYYHVEAGLAVRSPRKSLTIGRMSICCFNICINSRAARLSLQDGRHPASVDHRHSHLTSVRSYLGHHSRCRHSCGCRHRHRTSRLSATINNYIRSSSRAKNSVGYFQPRVWKSRETLSQIRSGLVDYGYLL